MERTCCIDCVFEGHEADILCGCLLLGLHETTLVRGSRDRQSPFVAKREANRCMLGARGQSEVRLWALAWSRGGPGILGVVVCLGVM